MSQFAIDRKRRHSATSPSQMRRRVTTATIIVVTVALLLGMTPHHAAAQEDRRPSRAPVELETQDIHLDTGPTLQGVETPSTKGLDVYEGEPVGPNEARWFSQLGTPTEDFHCGSVQITDVHFLTAGHCVKDATALVGDTPTATTLTFVGGSSSLLPQIATYIDGSTAGLSGFASDIEAHVTAGASDGTRVDLAVLTIDWVDATPNTSVPTISAQTSMPLTELAPGNALKMYGRGGGFDYNAGVLMRAEGGPMPDTLPAANWNTSCSNVLTWPNANLFCAAHTAWGSICPGDSGGPVIDNGLLVGILSQGLERNSDDCLSATYSGSVDLWLHRCWIEGHTDGKVQWQLPDGTEQTGLPETECLDDGVGTTDPNDSSNLGLLGPFGPLSDAWEWLDSNGNGVIECVEALENIALAQGGFPTEPLPDDYLLMLVECGVTPPVIDYYGEIADVYGLASSASDADIADFLSVEFAPLFAPNPVSLSPYISEAKLSELHNCRHVLPRPEGSAWNILLSEDHVDALIDSMRTLRANYQQENWDTFAYLLVNSNYQDDWHHAVGASVPHFDGELFTYWRNMLVPGMVSWLYLAPAGWTNSTSNVHWAVDTFDNVHASLNTWYIQDQNGPQWPQDLPAATPETYLDGLLPHVSELVNQCSLLASITNGIHDLPPDGPSGSSAPTPEGPLGLFRMMEDVPTSPDLPDFVHELSLFDGFLATDFEACTAFGARFTSYDPGLANYPALADVVAYMTEQQTALAASITTLQTVYDNFDGSHDSWDATEVATAFTNTFDHHGENIRAIVAMGSRLAEALVHPNAWSSDVGTPIQLLAAVDALLTAGGLNPEIETMLAHARNGLTATTIPNGLELGQTTFGLEPDYINVTNPSLTTPNHFDELVALCSIVNAANYVYPPNCYTAAPPAEGPVSYPQEAVCVS